MNMISIHFFTNLNVILGSLNCRNQLKMEITEMLESGTSCSAVIPADGSYVIAGIFFLQVIGNDSMVLLSKSVRETKFVIPSR